MSPEYLAVFDLQLNALLGENTPAAYRLMDYRLRGLCILHTPLAVIRWSALQW